MAISADFIGVLGFAIGDIENQKGQKLVNITILTIQIIFKNL